MDNIRSPNVISKITEVKKPFVFPNLNYTSHNASGRLFNGGTQAWMYQNSELRVFNVTNGVLRSTYDFADISHGNTKITSVVEYVMQEIKDELRKQTEHCLIVGYNTDENRAFISFYHPNACRVLNTISLKGKIKNLNLILPKRSHTTTVTGILKLMNGVLAIGMEEGIVCIMDIKSHNLLNEYYSFQMDAKNLLSDGHSSLIFIDVENDNRETIRGKISASKNNSEHVAFVLNADNLIDETRILIDCKAFDRNVIYVSCMEYIPQTMILAVGFNVGSCQLWDMNQLTCLHTTPIPSNPCSIVRFGFQEPCNDPQQCCYLWTVCESSRPKHICLPFAIMYSLLFKVKVDSSEGTRYKHFVHCKKRFHMNLDIGYNFDGACISSQVVSNTTSSMLGEGCDQNEVWNAKINLFITIFETRNRSKSSNCVSVFVFDMNQWYREQMPFNYFYGFSHTYINVISIDKLSGGLYNFFDAYVNRDTIEQFLTFNSPEQYRSPSSLSFDVTCLEKSKIMHLQLPGMQSYVLDLIINEGPLALVQPQRFYQMCHKVRLSPHISNNHPDHSSLNVLQMRNFVLTILLEQKKTQFLMQCVKLWINGSLSASYCTLDALINWGWECVAHIKKLSDNLCIPLFDYTGTELDRENYHKLKHCCKLIQIIDDLLNLIYSKHRNFLLDGGENLKQKIATLTLINAYFDVIVWCMDCGLLPEKVDATSESSMPAYIINITQACQQRRNQMKEFTNDDDIPLDGSLYLIDYLIESEPNHSQLYQQWEQENCKFSDGMYPPRTLQMLLRMYLIPSIPMDTKHSIMTYFLLDVSDYHKDEDVTKKLFTFTSVINCNSVVANFANMLWLVDHDRFEEAIDIMSERDVQKGDIMLEYHCKIMQVMLNRNEPKFALKYLEGIQPILPTYANSVLQIVIYLENLLVTKAFNVQRDVNVRARKKDLLELFFEKSNKMGVIKQVLNLTLDNSEEESFISYLDNCRNNKQVADDLKVLYFLNRRKFVEAICINRQINSVHVKNSPASRHAFAKLGNVIAGNIGRATTRDLYVEAFSKTLPPFTNELIQYYEKNWDTISNIKAPQKCYPLSTVTGLDVRNASNSNTVESFVSNAVIKSRELNLRQNPSQQSSEGNQSWSKLARMPFLRSDNICSASIIEVKKLERRSPPTVAVQSSFGKRKIDIFEPVSKRFKRDNTVTAIDDQVTTPTSCLPEQSEILHTPYVQKKITPIVSAHSEFATPKSSILKNTTTPRTKLPHKVGFNIPETSSPKSRTSTRVRPATPKFTVSIEEQEEPVIVEKLTPEPVTLMPLTESAISMQQTDGNVEQSSNTPSSRFFEDVNQSVDQIIDTAFPIQCIRTIDSYQDERNTVNFQTIPTPGLETSVIIRRVEPEIDEVETRNDENELSSDDEVGGEKHIVFAEIHVRTEDIVSTSTDHQEQHYYREESCLAVNSGDSNSAQNVERENRSRYDQLYENLSNDGSPLIQNYDPDSGNKYEQKSRSSYNDPGSDYEKEQYEVKDDEWRQISEIERFDEDEIRNEQSVIIQSNNSDHDLTTGVPIYSPKLMSSEERQEMKLEYNYGIVERETESAFLHHAADNDDIEPPVDVGLSRDEDDRKKFIDQSIQFTGNANVSEMGEQTKLPIFLTRCQLDTINKYHDMLSRQQSHLISNPSRSLRATGGEMNYSCGNDTFDRGDRSLSNNVESSDVNEEILSSQIVHDDGSDQENNVQYVSSETEEEVTGSSRFHPTSSETSSVEISRNYDTPRRQPFVREEVDEFRNENNARAFVRDDYDSDVDVYEEDETERRVELLNEEDYDDNNNNDSIDEENNSDDNLDVYNADNDNLDEDNTDNDNLDEDNTDNDNIVEDNTDNDNMDNDNSDDYNTDDNSIHISSTGDTDDNPSSNHTDLEEDNTDDDNSVENNINNNDNSWKDSTDNDNLEEDGAHSDNLEDGAHSDNLEDGAHSDNLEDRAHNDNLERISSTDNLYEDNYVQQEDYNFNRESEQDIITQNSPTYVEPQPDVECINDFNSTRQFPGNEHSNTSDVQHFDEPQATSRFISDEDKDLTILEDDQEDKVCDTAETISEIINDNTSQVDEQLEIKPVNRINGKLDIGRVVITEPDFMASSNVISELKQLNSELKVARTDENKELDNNKSEQSSTDNENDYDLSVNRSKNHHQNVTTLLDDVGDRAEVNIKNVTINDNTRNLPIELSDEIKEESVDQKEQQLDKDEHDESSVEQFINISEDIIRSSERNAIECIDVEKNRSINKIDLSVGTLRNTDYDNPLQMLFTDISDETVYRYIFVKNERLNSVKVDDESKSGQDDSKITESVSNLSEQNKPSTPTIRLLNDADRSTDDEICESHKSKIIYADTKDNLDINDDNKRIPENLNEQLNTRNTKPEQTLHENELLLNREQSIMPSPIREFNSTYIPKSDLNASSSEENTLSLIIKTPSNNSSDGELSKTPYRKTTSWSLAKANNVLRVEQSNITRSSEDVKNNGGAVNDKLRDTDVTVVDDSSWSLVFNAPVNDTNNTPARRRSWSVPSRTTLSRSKFQHDDKSDVKIFEKPNKIETSTIKENKSSKRNNNDMAMSDVKELDNRDEIKYLDSNDTDLDNSSWSLTLNTSTNSDIHKTPARRRSWSVPSRSSLPRSCKSPYNRNNSEMETFEQMVETEETSVTKSGNYDTSSSVAGDIRESRLNKSIDDLNRTNTSISYKQKDRKKRSRSLSNSRRSLYDIKEESHEKPNTTIEQAADENFTSRSLRSRTKSYLVNLPKIPEAFEEDDGNFKPTTSSRLITRDENLLTKSRRTTRSTDAFSDTNITTISSSSTSNKSVDRTNIRKRKSSRTDNHSTKSDEPVSTKKIKNDTADKIVPRTRSVTSDYEMKEELTPESVIGVESEDSTAASVSNSAISVSSNDTPLRRSSRRSTPQKPYSYPTTERRTNKKLFKQLIVIDSDDEDDDASVNTSVSESSVILTRSQMKNIGKTVGESSKVNIRETLPVTSTPTKISQDESVLSGDIISIENRRLTRQAALLVKKATEHPYTSSEIPPQKSVTAESTKSKGKTKKPALLPSAEDKDTLKDYKYTSTRSKKDK